MFRELALLPASNNRLPHTDTIDALFARSA